MPSQPSTTLSPTLSREQAQTLADRVAPVSMLIGLKNVSLDRLVAETLYIYSFPHYLETGWLYELINQDLAMDISLHISPKESALALPELRRKLAQFTANLNDEADRGLVSNPELEANIQDIEVLREELTRGVAKLFSVGHYITLYAPNQSELKQAIRQVQTILGGSLIYTRSALLQAEAGFLTSLPIGQDRLNQTQSLDTPAIASGFPFASAALTSDQGWLYGINRHNNSLVILDRFQLDNANSLVLGSSGSGKSYLVKLEILRALMLDTDVIVIDPENEYVGLAEAMGGTWIDLSLGSNFQINPLDLPPADAEDSGAQILRETIVAGHALIALMVGGLSPVEGNQVDQALKQAYNRAGITEDLASQTRPAPLLSDLARELATLPGTQELLVKLQTYINGTFAGLLNHPTNIDLGQGFIVFSIRDLEDQLRPIASYLTLTFIWNKIKHRLRHRLLIVDEIWSLLQQESAAAYLYSFAKRARKYQLGLTAISQDVEDFLDNKYGRSIINNSALQILLRQSTSAITKVAEAFNLTEGERLLLLESNVGEGLLFAGNNHIAIKAIGSAHEDETITGQPVNPLGN